MEAFLWRTAVWPKSKLISRFWQKLSELSRSQYGLSGAVQHGASTLPDEAFDRFPAMGTAEIHLATGFQNIIYDSSQFPQRFERKNIRSFEE